MTNTSISPEATLLESQPNEQERTAQLKKEFDAIFLRGEHIEALRLAEQGLAQFTKHGEQQGQAMALNLIGIAYRNMRNLTASLEALQKCLDIREAIGDTVGVAQAINGMGLTYNY
ncbi:MAG: tetratricopeptide repeat protein, partial [Cytophagaceae bacterium]